MKPSGSKPPFFLVHALLGSTFPYQLLAVHLDADQPLYGLQARGLDGSQPPLEAVEEMAGAYIEAIRTVQPAGPYFLGGYSFGGSIAYEMAQQLVRQGERVAMLVMLGTSAPSPRSTALAPHIALFLKSMEDLQRLITNSLLSERIPGAEMFAWMFQGQRMLSPMSRVIAANTRASLRYQPRPYSGRIDVFVTEDLRQMSPGDLSLGWKMLCSGLVESCQVEGTHLSMFQEPEVRDLASKLTASLEKARKESVP